MNNNIFEKIKKSMNISQNMGRFENFISVEYNNFLPVLAKVKDACKNSGQDIHNHFVDMHEMVDLGSGGKREVEDVHLSRYTCCLVIQNFDPAKEVVAFGQTYFAIQTRIQE